MVYNYDSMQHRTRKRFGQHFLIDQQVIDQIINVIYPKANDLIVEIGPGAGALTTPLLNKLDCLHVIELDRDLIDGLVSMSTDDHKIIVHEGDALKFDFNQLDRCTDKTLRIVGNLPYNISTPILFHLIDFIECTKDIHVMLQREVVERCVASPGSKQYGRLSIILQYYYHIDLLFYVAADAFNPPPKVESAVMRLTPREKPAVTANDLKTFKHVVAMAFQQRRKTILNNLKKIIDGEALEQLGISPKDRPEQLTVEQFVLIANAVLLKMI